MRIEFELRMSRRLKRLLKTALVLCVMGAVFFITLSVLNSDTHAVQGVSVHGISLHQLPPDEAQKILEKKRNDFLKTAITIQTQHGDYISATPWEMGVIVDINSSMNAAYTYGRDGSAARMMLQQARALFFGKKFALDVRIDPSVFVHFMDNTLAPLHQPAINAEFAYNTETENFDFVPAQTGKVLDARELQEKIISGARVLSTEPIQITQSVEEPLVTDTGAEIAKQNAQALLAAMPYTIHAQDESWEIEKDDIVSWIEFVLAQAAAIFGYGSILLNHKFRQVSCRRGYGTQSLVE